MREEEDKKARLQKNNRETKKIPKTLVTVDRNSTPTSQQLPQSFLSVIYQRPLAEDESKSEILLTLVTKKVPLCASINMSPTKTRSLFLAIFSNQWIRM